MFIFSTGFGIFPLLSASLSFSLSLSLKSIRPLTAGADAVTVSLALILDVYRSWTVAVNAELFQSTAAVKEVKSLIETSCIPSTVEE